MWAGIICLFMGLIFGIFGFLAIMRRESLLVSGVTTTAVLSRFVRKRNSNSNTYYNECYYSFTHKDGAVYEVKSHSTTFNDYLGKETIIYYDPQNPQNIYSLNVDRFGNFFGIFVGLILIVIGTYILVVNDII